MKKEIKQYSENKKTIIWIFAALCDWMIILLSIAIALWMHNFFVYAFAVFVVGTRQHALAQLGYDGAHYLVSNNHNINDFLTNLFCWWPLCIGMTGYRRFHFEHHRYVGTRLDPELKMKKFDKPQWDIPLKEGRMIRYFIEDLFGLHITHVLHYFNEIKHVKKKQWTGTIIMWSLILLALYFTHSLEALFIWFVALSTSFWAVFRVRIYHEHLGTGYTHRVTVPWWYGLIIAPHNTWLHYEHHRWPNVPYYYLPKIRKLIGKDNITSVRNLFESFEKNKKIPSGKPLRLLEKSNPEKAF